MTLFVSVPAPSFALTRLSDELTKCLDQVEGLVREPPVAAVLASFGKLRLQCRLRAVSLSGPILGNPSPLSASSPPDSTPEQYRYPVAWRSCSLSQASRDGAVATANTSSTPVMASDEASSRGRAAASAAAAAPGVNNGSDSGHYEDSSRSSSSSSSSSGSTNVDSLAGDGGRGEDGNETAGRAARQLDLVVEALDCLDLAPNLKPEAEISKASFASTRGFFTDPPPQITLCTNSPTYPATAVDLMAHELTHARDVSTRPGIPASSCCPFAVERRSREQTTAQL